MLVFLHKTQHVQLKDYRNVKCGDLPSVPTMKQCVCVCVCVQSNTVLQCSAAAAAAAQRSGSVLRRLGVTRDRLLPHSSAARRCRERENKRSSCDHGNQHSCVQLKGDNLQA